MTKGISIDTHRGGDYCYEYEVEGTTSKYAKIKKNVLGDTRYIAFYAGKLVKGVRSEFMIKIVDRKLNPNDPNSPLGEPNDPNLRTIFHTTNKDQVTPAAQFADLLEGCREDKSGLVLKGDSNESNNINTAQ